MFRPVRLVRITIQVPEEQISAVMAVLGEFRFLHLIQIEETHLGRLGYVAKADTFLLQQYDSLLARANRLLRELSPASPLKARPKALRPDKALYKISEEMDTIEKEALATITKREETRDEISRCESLILKMSLLESMEVSFERLNNLRYAGYMVGLLPGENLPRLEESLSDIHHALIPLEKKGDKVVIMAFALREDLGTLTRALKSAFFDPLEIPQDVQGTPAQVKAKLTRELEGLKAGLSELDQEQERLREKFGRRLQYLREEILLARHLLQALEKFGQIDHSYLITGWVPYSQFPALKERILEATSGKALVEQVDPEEIREVRSGIVKIPILFNNPLLIRPFERLTTLYGIPSYEEIEPTVFLAISFLLLFGIMFGDLGHGAVLFGVGYYIFKKVFRNMDYGIILMECGVSSMIFGALYGSVFGLEDIIPALWMHPMENIEYFMKVSAFLGVGIISLGLILNLINIFRQRRYGELLSASGLAGALLYWLTVGLLVRYLLVGELSSREWLFAEVAGGVLFALMLFHKPVGILLKRLLHEEAPRPAPSGAGISLLESFIEVMDDLLKYLANTVSFVRVAAFALTHAGLFVAVFSMADMIKQTHGGGLFYWLVIVLGNIIIICLEGLIVSIQTIRLEYYEFFGKFFRGGGEPFRPAFRSE